MKNLLNNMKQIKIPITVIILTYLIFSFVALELNPLNWREGVRISYILIISWINILVYINKL